MFDFSYLTNLARQNGKITQDLKILNKKIKLSIRPVEIENSNNIELFLIEFSEIDLQINEALQAATQKFGLTKSEVEIVKLLLNGEGVSEIAIKRNSSRETVRAQLRSLRAKTGAKSQVELIAIIRDNDKN